MREFVQHVIDRTLDKLRLGFYTLTSSGNQDYNRVQGEANWGAPVRSLRRVSNPILDVIPKVGSKLAILSQDGVVELGAWIGEIFDDETEAGTVWIRANLEDNPGILNLGATKAIVIEVGSNGQTVTVKPDGTVWIDGDSIELGGNTAGLLKELLFSTLVTHTHPVSGAVATASAELAIANTAETTFPGTYVTQKVQVEATETP